MSANYKQCRKKTEKGKRCKNPIYYIKGENSRLCKLHFYTDMYKDEPMEPTAVSCAEVIPGVWIGSISAAQKDKKFLKNAKIKSILNSSGMEPPAHIKRFYNNQNIQYKTFTTYRDGRETYMPDKNFDSRFTKLDFFAYILDGIKFMKKAPKPILVHCHAGINRSGSCLAGYMMLCEKIPYDKTIKLLTDANAKRGWSVLTNKHFRSALKELETKMRSRTRTTSRSKTPSKRSKSPRKRGRPPTPRKRTKSPSKKPRGRPKSPKKGGSSPRKKSSSPRKTTVKTTVKTTRPPTPRKTVKLGGSEHKHKNKTVSKRAGMRPIHITKSM